MQPPSQLPIFDWGFLITVLLLAVLEEDNRQVSLNCLLVGKHITNSVYISQCPRTRYVQRSTCRVVGEGGEASFVRVQDS